jgi:hypothetical protein
VPASIDISLPCELPPALPGAAGAPTVLATARDTKRAAGLRIARTPEALVFSVGRKRLAALPWPSRAVGCPLVVRVADGALILPDRRVPIGSAYPSGMPTVSALISELDLRARSGVEARITTRIYATSPTGRQVAATVAALLFGLGALLLVRSGLLTALDRSMRGLPRMLRQAGPVDAGVVGLLLVWWVLGPAFGDDGWIWMHERVFSQVGAFSIYLDAFGANAPLNYWLEWLHHWLVGVTDQLVLLRLPALVALVASWFLARWCLRRAVGSVEPRAVRWSLAAAFAVLAMAWGMTLRPEPFISLLVLTNLAAALSFARAPRIAPLIVGALATALALTTHPAGILALAPIVAIAPQLLASLRGRVVSRSGVAALVLVGLSLTVLLTFVDRDLDSWNADRQLVEQIGYYDGSWWQEWTRYSSMVDQRSWAASLRHMSVALLLLAVLGYVTRRRLPGHRAALAIPARSLTIALLLLVLMPSKHAWHFGVLVGIGAVALAAECTRLLGEGRAQPARPLRPFVAVELVFAALIWSWTIRLSWTLLDLQTMTWDDAFGAVELRGSGFLTWLVILLVLVVIAGVVDRLRTRRGRPTPADMPWRLAAWSVPAVSAVLIVATCAVLAVDTARASGWAPARQHLAALAGRSECGLADQIRVAVAPRSTTNGSTTVLATSMRTNGTKTLVDHLVAPYFPCADLPSVAGGVAETPQLIVSRRWIVRPVQRAQSSFAGVLDLYTLRLLYDSKSVRVFSVDERVPGAVIARATRVSQ